MSHQQVAAVVVEIPTLPAAQDLPEYEREIFSRLENELHKLRDRGAHEVLGVPWDATIADVRRGYFQMTKRYHPDVFARYHSSAIAALAQELFIYINRAYDRMRGWLAAEGIGLIAGPALLCRTGWLATVDDGDEATDPWPRGLNPETWAATTSGDVPGDGASGADRQIGEETAPEASKPGADSAVPLADAAPEHTLFGDLELGDPDGGDDLEEPDSRLLRRLR